MTPATTPPEVSIVVPWAGEATLRECLDALGKSPSVEIVVVDNRRDPRPVDIPGLVREELPGVAAARNRGFRESRGQYVFFIDADCIPEPDWAGKMLAQIKATGADAVQGPVLSRQEHPVARFIQAEFDQRQARLQKHRRIALISTGNSGFSRRALEEAGGFDASLRRGEDTDLSFRLRQKGFHLRYIDEPVVWHAHPTRARDLLRRKYGYGFWLARVYVRNPGRVAENTRTPRLQLAAIGLWFLWLPAAWLFGLWGFLLIPLLIVLTSFPLLSKAGPVALLLTPLGTLMNAVGLVAGFIGIRRSDETWSSTKTGDAGKSA